MAASRAGPCGRTTSATSSSPSGGGPWTCGSPRGGSRRRSDGRCGRRSSRGSRRPPGRPAPPRSEPSPFANPSSPAPARRLCRSRIRSTAPLPHCSIGSSPRPAPPRWLLPRTGRTSAACSTPTELLPPKGRRHTHQDPERRREEEEEERWWTCTGERLRSM